MAFEPKKFTEAEVEVIRRFLADREAFWDYEADLAECYEQRDEAKGFRENAQLFRNELGFYLPRHYTK